MAEYRRILRCNHPVREFEGLYKTSLSRGLVARQVT